MSKFIASSIPAYYGFITRIISTYIRLEWHRNLNWEKKYNCLFIVGLSMQICRALNSIFNFAFTCHWYHIDHSIWAWILMMPILRWVYFPLKLSHNYLLEIDYSERWSPCIDLVVFFACHFEQILFDLIDKNAAWRHTYHSRRNDGPFTYGPHFVFFFLHSIKSSQIVFIWIYSIHNLLCLFALISTKSHFAIWIINAIKDEFMLLTLFSLRSPPTISICAPHIYVTLYNSCSG